MRIREFESVLAGLLTDADNPEIVDVRSCSEQNPQGHTRLHVRFASGADAYIMVRRVAGRGIPSHAPFELPREAF
ncbi:MAG TPA: hypothetical protein VGX25_23990 [Actinophytocola sp.]|uniref:hypothetical protein n=1 Tax=Actinophytocola sp. TaxID=1872138 RepID=UPI002DDD30A6|nr:hypothetical protein [Actinophytocola sp.]HEV2782466.1 hypothetical protein [Actinophytocola sp.]